MCGGGGSDYFENVPWMLGMEELESQNLLTHF